MPFGTKPKKRRDALLDALERVPVLQKSTREQARPMWEHVLEMERKLSSCPGWPPISDWWKDVVLKFYQSRKRQLVARVGRRGGKSTTICRIAVLEALYGRHEIPAGDIGIVGIVSTNRGEAAEKIRLIKALLDALKVQYRERSGEIFLINRPIKFKVFAATMGAVVGGTWICAICDELTRWRDEQTHKNPADEVLASLRPCLATMPNAKLFLISSPLGNLDVHARYMEQGNTPSQVCVEAPTWIAHPALTEEYTHTLEPNSRIWRREYAAVPQGALSAVFDLEDIDNCMALYHKLIEPEATAEPIMAIDPSRGHDAWTYCIGQWIWWNGNQYLLVSEIGQVPNGSDTRQSVDWLVTKCRKHKISIIASDQYEAGSLSVLFSEQNISLIEFKWTAPTKKEAVDRAERQMRDQVIALPVSDIMRRQLAEYSEKISRSGEVSYSGSGRHDDYAAVILTLIMADINQRLQLVEPPEQKKSAGEVIQQRWVDTQTQRMMERKALEREWGAYSMESLADELQYLP